MIGMEEHNGFTLAELLIAVTAVTLLAAIILPNLLRSKVAAEESAAISSVREINRAEVAYQAAYPAVGFSSALAALGPASPGSPCTVANPQHACLLDGKLSNAASSARSRNGYWFLVTPTTIRSNGVVTGYVLGSAFAGENKSEVRDFCSTEDGVLHFRVEHQPDRPVTSATECQKQAVLQ
jgi:type IV pilus assembly protein PilA